MTKEQKVFLAQLRKSNPSLALQTQRQYLDAESARTGQSVAEILKGSQTNQYQDILKENNPDLALERKRASVDTVSRRTGQSPKQVLQGSQDNQYLDALMETNPSVGLSEKTRIVGEQANRAGKTVAEQLKGTDTSVSGIGKSQELMDMARGPKAPSLGAAVPFGSAPTPTTPEGPENQKPDVIDYTDAPIEGPQNQKAQSFLDKRYEQAPASMTPIGSKSFNNDINRANNFIAQNQQLEARKEFAADLYKNKFNPETASDENRKNYFERGESMGLSPQQMDKYTQRYLKPSTQEDGQTQPVEDTGRPSMTAGSVAGGRRTLQTKSTSDGATKIGTRAGELRKMARKARKQGYGRTAEKYFDASLNADLATPNIRSQEYRGARADRIAQLQQDRDATSQRARNFITGSQFTPTRYY